MSDSLHDELKKHTVELHKKAYSVPYINNLLNNKVILKSYIGHLEAFAGIYGSLENHLNSVQQSTGVEFIDHYFPKLPLIRDDLDYLKTDEKDKINEVVNIASRMAKIIEHDAGLRPFKTLGYLYTLEGSLNGGKILKEHLEYSLDLPDGKGTSYLSCYDSKFKNFWETFLHELNSKVITPEQKTDVISGAEEIFRAVLEIYKKL